MTLRNKSVYSIVNTFLDNCKVLKSEGNYVLLQVKEHNYVEYATFEVNDSGVFNGEYFKKKYKANNNFHNREIEHN